MENEEIIQTEARITRQNDDGVTRDSSKGQDHVKAFAGVPVDEEMPLLNKQPRRSEDGSSPPPVNAWYDPEFEGLPWYKRPGIFWMLGPFLIVALAFGGIIVTKLVLIQDLLCEQYFAQKAAKDPSFTFMPIRLDQDNKQCNAPEVTSLVSVFMLYASLLSGLPTVVLAPILGAYSDRHGRTKVLAVTSLGSLMGEIITILVASYPETISVYWILLGYVFDGLSGSFIVSMAICNAYAADCTPPTKRAQAFGYVYGCLFSGIALGPIVSAQLVRLTGNILVPFYFALGVHAAFILFARFIIPDSLTTRRKIAARKAWADMKTTDRHESGIRHSFNVVRSLRILWPKGEGASAVLRRNLVLLASVDTLFFGVAMGAITTTLVYTGQAFDWDHAMKQYYVSIVNICRVTVLLAVLPSLNRLVRGKASSDRKESHTGADKTDLAFIRIGILFDLVGFIGFATAKTGTMFILSGALASAGGIVNPTLSSALTRHMPAHLTGQLLGAIGVLHALARVISPAIFNGIFALTAGIFPQTVFVCLACAFGLTELLSWFVKPNVYYVEQSTVDEEDERPRSSMARDIVQN